MIKFIPYAHSVLESLDRTWFLISTSKEKKQLYTYTVPKGAYHEHNVISSAFANKNEQLSEMLPDGSDGQLLILGSFYLNVVKNQVAFLTIDALTPTRQTATSILHSSQFIESVLYEILDNDYDDTLKPIAKKCLIKDGEYDQVHQTAHV